MTEEHVLTESVRDVLFFAQVHRREDLVLSVLPVNYNRMLNFAIWPSQPVTMIRELPVSSPKPWRVPFGFISMVFQRLNGLFAILLILGWVVPAQFMELSKASQRATIDSSKRAKPMTYLALGDSTCLGLGAKNANGYVEQLTTRIEKERPGSRLLKLCRLGETTTSLRQRLTESVSIKPTLVTLSIGMNDLLGRISEQEFAANYEAIVIRLRRLAVPIVITNLPDISFAPRLPNSMREEIRVKVLLFNKQIEAIAGRYGLFFTDLYAACAKELTKHQEFFASDGFHPSDAGYEFWTRTMWPTVKNAITGEG